jgi:galactokinase/mevalonate kinase-like predicted kinase
MIVFYRITICILLIFIAFYEINSNKLIKSQLNNNKQILLHLKNINEQNREVEFLAIQNSILVSNLADCMDKAWRIQKMVDTFASTLGKNAKTTRH